MADARYLGSMNPDELRKLGKQRAIEELAKRSTNRSEKPSGEDPSKGQYLGSMPPDELILRMELMRDKAKKDYLRENYESRNVLEDTAAALTAGTLQLAEMSARAARLGREPEDTPNLTKFIEGIDKFREDKQFLKPSREALTREGRRWLYEGVSSAIPSVGLGLPGAAVGSFGGPIGTVGGFAGSAGTVFGMAEFDEFWENARKGAKEGKIDPAMMSEINKKALMSAFAEGGMEAVSNAIDMLAFKVGKVVTAPLKESVRGMLTKGVKGVAKDMAKGYAVALPNEVATEMMQNYLTTKMRKDLGINEVEPIEAAKQSAGPAAVMTLLFGVGAAKFNYEQRLSALKALQDPDTKTKARMAAARAIADELKVYDDKHGTTYAKQWVGDSFSSIMRKKPVDIDSKIIKKYSQEPRKGEEPPEAEPPVQEAPPETPPPPPGSGEITGGPGTTPPPMGEDEPILPEDELDAEDAAKEHDEDDLDKIIETDDAADETDTEPTDAEIEAGNYKKGHVKLHGMDISIENPRGSTRKGADEDGKEWETTFTHHYGYIKGTVGRDKDHIDTFIGPNPASDRAFVVNQVNPKTGKFDEHKIMLGFDSIEEAQQGYLSNYEAGWTGLGSIHELDVEDLRTWTKDGDTKIEYDPQDYPEFHEETIDDEETVTGGAPGTPAPGGEIGITGGPRPQGETGGIGLPEDILKGLEEIFGEKPPAGEVQGGERVPEGEKPGEPAKDQNIAIKDLLVRNGWNTNEEYGYIKDGGEDRVWILSKVPEAWSEETVPPKSMDDPVIVQLEEYSGKVLETKRYDTFREFIDAELVKYGDMFEDQGEIEAKGQKEKPGEITGGERAPKGEKPEGETKPAEGETTAPSGETKPEKPKKEESKQDKAVKAFDELADESVNKTEKDAFAIIDQEDSGQYGRLVESVMHILRDIAKSVKSMKGHPDQVKKNVENALELLSESDSWIGSISESSRSLGANMATQFNSLTVYNKAQWLAREIGDAVGEGRFQDALKYLNEIKTKLGKGNADYSKWVMSFKMNDDGTLKPYTSLQEKGKLKWGKKIGGSRADIAGMSGTQKKAEVNKEFVWPSPDYVSMVKQGTEPHVAYLIKRIRDSIPASPKGDLSDSDFDIYVESLEQIRDSFDNVRTEDEMKDACSGLLALAKVARRAEGNQASVFRNRKWMNTSELLYRGSIKKFEKEIKYVDENGWPGGGAWRRGIRIVETTARNENDDIVEVWAIERRLGQGRFEYWGQVATGFETREAAEKYLEETLRPQIEQELKNRKLTRPRLKKVIRKGPDYRGGKDIEPEKFLKTFGFRKGWGEEGAGMETGKWNKSILQTYLNCAYDSFMDLARALNVDPKVMSLNGRISIAFGARGHGGLAMAHYESTRMVINLTKMNGAGSLAHEWGHALDHYMRSLFSETPGMAGHYLSDFTFKTSFYDAGHLNGNDELREAMYLLWNDRMHSRYSTPSEILALAENVISKNKSTLSVLIENLSKKVKDEGKIERFTKMTEEIIDADPADAAKKIDALGTLYQELSGSTLETKYIVGLKDNYKYIAVKLREAEDAKNGVSVGYKRLTDWVRGFDRIPSKARREYYSSPIEMWARAFESFIEDTIAGYGLSSNYLVHGTFNDKYSSPIYPSDEERDSINTGISDVIKLLGFPEFKEESKPIITTEWDNPQFEEDEEETEGPEETETETPTAEITIEDYTEKSIVVRDHTPDGKHKKRIAELGGEYNPNLKRGAPGFIFPKWKRERVEEAFADILYGGEHGKPIYPYQDLQLEDLKSNEKVGILAKNMLALLKSGWHVGKNATAIRAEVARMLNTKPDKITDWGQGYTKDIDELIEYALVMRSREIIDSAEVAGENIKETYDRLKDLYENQPRLGSRTSDSAENQAYSTPLHIAWIMQKASEIGEKTSVYEPTAGTGMLLAMASPENVTANEIDKRRRAILKDQGMAEVTDIDGRKAVSLSGTLKAFDVVLANPPFGKTDSKSIDGFLMSKLEHQIAVDALKAMKDRGRAAIIIGGHNFKDGKMSVTDKIFFNWLYSKYNVTANIEMPGSVYAKQGTTFPFRILFINGVNKTGKGIAPEKDDIISLGSTDDLFDLLQKGELYGARRISPEGTEDVEEGMGPVGGSGGARGGGKGFGSSDVLPGPGGETGDDGGKKPKPGGRASGSTGGPSGGIMAPGTEGSGGGTGTDDGRTGGTGDGSADVPAGAGGPGSPGVGEGQGGSQRGRTGRPGEESGLEDIPGISPVEKQIASMSDEDIDSLVDGLVEKNTEKSAGDLAKEAGKELAAGLHDAVKGLTTLFTPKDTLSMGLVFDEETYRKALPLFQSSLEHIKASGIIGKEAVEKLASDLLNKFGNSIAPFVKRFMKEVRTETKNLHQVPYEALSKRPPVEDTFIPKNMARPLRQALERIQNQVGDIDAYITSKLEYPDVKTMWEHFSPDQIDAIAIGIYNMSRGQTLIVGDQTGVGKGRVGAAMIRYAHLQGKRAVFFTEKPNLFTDNYRDIVDIGWGDKFKPFIVASNEELADIRDQEGTKVFELLPSDKRRAAMAKFAGTDDPKEIKKYGLSGTPADEDGLTRDENVLADYNTILVTYSQVNVENLQRRFLSRVARGSMLILDESHNAAGSGSNTGEYMQGLIQGLGPNGDLMFLSATFAKRPDTMGLYIQRTAQEAANMKPKEIVDAIIAGKTPMQEWVCASLTKTGQHVRREKSFRGIEMRTYFDSKNRELHEGIADGVMENAREIMDVDRKITKAFNAAVARAIKAGSKDPDAVIDIFGVPWKPGWVKGDDGKARMSNTVSKSNFAATVHNLVRQTLFSLKCDLAVEQAIKELEGKDNPLHDKDGYLIRGPRRQKPVIAVSGTLESFLMEASKSGELVSGNSYEMKLKDVIRIYHRRNLRVLIKDRKGNEQRYTMNPDLFPEDLKEEFYRVERDILEKTPDLPGSPIDYMIYKLRKAGVRVGEITGRKFMLEHDLDTGRPVFKPRKDKRAEAIIGFNNGPSRNEDIPELDCLIVNSAGSAGLSIHAGPKTDKVPRIYLGVQAELDIDKEVQKMGRINRKGQVVLPEFRHLALDIPAEVRPATILSRKMRSMSANTSANADSPLANKDFPDMINHHGDEITYEWMTDHTEVMVSMGTDDLTYLNVSGKIAIQPVAVQREFFDEVEETYNLRMENLKKRGEWDLDVETYDYRADTVSKDITVEGSNEDNPFGGSTYMEEVTTENRSKPMWWDEITKEIEKELGGKTPEEYNEAFLEKMRERMEEYRKKVLARWEEAKEKRRQAAEKKKAEAPKEGEDYITDDIDTGKTDKGQDDKEEKEPAILAKMKKQYDDLEHLLTGGSLFSPNFEVGTTLRITRGFSVGATVLKIRARGKEGNPVEPGKIEVTLAFTGMEREIEIPLSKLRRMHDEGKEDDYIMAHEDIGGERWDSMRSALVRETRHIVTGNLLQGFIGFQGSRRAQLIRYTTIDGNVKDGIIMPRGFESPTDSSTSLVRISQNKAYAFMQASGLNRSDQYLDDEAVRVTPSEIRVAGSRQLGGKYFLDPELKSLVKQNNFEKSGKYYIAQYNQANQKEIIDVLTKLGCRFSVLRGAYNIAFGGLEEQDDLAEFALGGKKVAQNQLLVSAINNAIAPITEKWGGGPRIYVLENIGKLPDGLREQAYRANSSSPGSVRGIYHRGSVYLIAENLSGAAEAQEVLLHEIIGHHGLRRAFGRRLDSLLDEVFSLMSKKDKDLVNKYYGFNLSRKSGQRRLAEEYIAKQAEKGALTPTIWQKIIAAIRKWLAEMGFSIKASDEKLQEIVTHALSMSRMYMNSEEATEGPDAYSIAEDKPEIDTKSLFPEEIIAALAPILKRWKNHPDITVADSISELPAGLRRQAIMAGAITGAFYNDTVYLVADGIGSIDEAYKTILHETVGHWGLRKTLGPGFDSFLSRLYADIDKARLQPIAEQYGLDLSKRSDQLVCMEEYLASLAERDERPAAWRRLVAWVRTWLMNMGFKLKTSQSDVDMLIASALGKARKYVQGGTAYAVEGFEGGQPVLRVAAFHGSPHTFDKFSTEKIGTGEGAQAYGYGLYFSGKREVAEWYREELTRVRMKPREARVLVDGEPIGSVLGLTDLTSVMKAKVLNALDIADGDISKAEFGLREQIRGAEDLSGPLPSLREKYAPAFSFLESLRGKNVTIDRTREVGHLYEVELAPDEDEYLLWDKPLSEQGEKVKKAISDDKKLDEWFNSQRRRDAGVKLSQMAPWEDTDRLTGRDFYRTLSDMIGRDNHERSNGAIRNESDDKAASEYLRSLGIRGIKYLDGTSRGKGEGTYNYVIFSDQDVEIKARFRKQERAERLRAKGVRPEEVTRFRVAPSPTETPLDTKSLFPEVQKRLDEAKGIGNLVRTKEKAKHHVSAMWHSFRRHFPHLDPDETGDLINILRIYEAVPEYSKYKAKGMIEDILGGLTDDEYTVFSYNIILADLMKDLDDPILGATMIEKDELPFGYTNKDQVEKDLNHFRDQAIKSPAIMEALRKREKSITDLRHNLVRYGLLDKKVLEDTNYYHHQVMEYWGLKRMTKGAGVSSKDVRPHKKGWMIAREGSIKDYNTEYIESEFEVFAQGIAQVETKKTMDRLDRSANIIKSLRAQAKLKNYGACLAIFEEMGLIERVENEKTGEMREITPFTPIEQQIAIGFSMLEKLAFDDKLEAPQEYQGVLDWLAQEYLNRKGEYGFFDGIDDSPTHPKLWAYLSYIVQRKDPGSGAAARIFKGIKEKERLMKDTLGAKFRTFENEIPEGYTIWRPEPNTAWYMTNSITDQVLEQVLKGEKSLKDEDVRKVLARGVDAMWVIPEGLAATLSNFREYKDEGPVGKAAEFTVTSWKQWILINPFRVIKYNLNNMSGDFDICWAYDPDIIRKYAWGAAKDLWMEARHKEISPVLKAELEEAHRVGVLGTGMTVQDIPDITNQMTLDGYLEVLSGRNVSYISKTWNVLKKYTTYRENILRLASYRYFRDRIISGEKNIYGASNADMIDKIKNDTDRAAHLARELVGDYGNITVAGQWMRRKLIPFYSWCVPEYTEILTREGWKTYDQLRVGEEALTYNIQKRTTEWQEVQDKAAYPFDGDLVTIQNSYGFKYQFTEDHRVVVIEKYKDQRKVVLAKDLKTHQHIPLVAPHEFTGVSVLSETDAALLGWLVTDGYFRVRAKSPNSFEAMLYQKKAECVELIRDKFAEYISSESVHPETGVICFRLKAAKLGEIRKVFGSKDDLPGIVTQLGEKECQAMYDAMLAAEGTAVNGFVAFPQNNGPVLGAFQILCYMLGKAGHIRPKTCRGKEQHSLYVKKGDKIQLSKWKNTREHYNGMVWCPKTENGTWIMRQNGKVMITGNCEINAPRYVRLFHNLPMEGEGRGRLATALSAKLAGKAFKLSAKMMTLYGLVVLWNMIFFPDEEDELGDMQRSQLHLILGRRGDGSIITVRFQGALSDALSWFGLENPAKELSDLAEGRKTWGEQGWELIKSAPNRFINSAQPFVKLAAETLMGKSLFPDAFNPRPIRDRVEHASRMFSLENIYKHAAGKPTRNQWRELDFWQDFLYLWGYEQLPGEAAYFDTRERVRRFLDRKGLNPGYFQADSSSKSAALYNYRRAMQLGDVEVAKKNYDRYMELGGTKQSMKTSMRLSHPAAGIPKKHREEFYRSLTERDRERMQAAVEWYNTIYGGM